MTGPEPSSAGDWPGGQEGLARLADEVRLLVEMVVEHALPWLEEVLAAGHGSPRQDTEHHSPPEGGEAGCEWCPLCAVVSVARGRSPEFVVRVFEQAAQVVALLRAVLADRWQPDDGVHMPGFRPPERPDQDTESGRVQHITVRKRDDWDVGSR